MLDHHEVIFAEGAPTESFRPGPIALSHFTPEHRAQVYAVYPGLEDEPEDALGPTARTILKCSEAQRLVSSGALGNIIDKRKTRNNETVGPETNNVIAIR